jgi:hypothetical protein
MRTRFFISFIHEEEELAKFICDSFNHLFVTHAEFFVSSGGILPGEEWLRRIEKEVEQSEAIILVLSENSLHRSWINIEAGAFWIKGKTLFPLCHGDLNMSEIHRPPSDFLSTRLYDPKSVAELIASISRILKLKAPPSFDVNDFCDKVMEIDKALFRFFASWDEIMKTLDLVLCQHENI